MTDTEKIALIDHIIADAWEFGCLQKDDAFYQGVLSAVASVINFEGKEEENAED